jgi:hypothetical protein
MRADRGLSPPQALLAIGAHRYPSELVKNFVYRLSTNRKFSIHMKVIRGDAAHPSDDD